jgi:hypothetical protein
VIMATVIANGRFLNSLYSRDRKLDWLLEISGSRRLNTFARSIGACF